MASKLTSADIKKFIVSKVGGTAADWKRVSKSGDALKTVRVFENVRGSVGDIEVETSEGDTLVSGWRLVRDSGKAVTDDMARGVASDAAKAYGWQCHRLVGDWRVAARYPAMAPPSKKIEWEDGKLECVELLPVDPGTDPAFCLVYVRDDEVVCVIGRRLAPGLRAKIARAHLSMKYKECDLELHSIAQVVNVPIALDVEGGRPWEPLDQENSEWLSVCDMSARYSCCGDWQEPMEFTLAHADDGKLYALRELQVVQDGPTVNEIRADAEKHAAEAPAKTSDSKTDDAQPAASKPGCCGGGCKCSSKLADAVVESSESPADSALKTLKSEIASRDARIAQLEKQVSGMQTQIDTLSKREPTTEEKLRWFSN